MTATDPHAFDCTGGRPVDVCLLLEGTYPYITGGVSSWVHDIISGMPELSFALFYIGARRALDTRVRYALPGNVQVLRRLYLFDDDLSEAPQRRPAPARRRLYATLERLHDGIRSGDLQAVPPEIVDALAGPPRGRAGAAAGGTARDAQHGGDAGGAPRSRCPLANARNFLEDREAWELLTRLYERCSREPSFIDYFWSIRFMHLPIWRLLAAVDHVPPAHTYHTVSTGFAGLLGSLVHARRGRPLLLTEHGIYTKERKIELAQAGWIHATRQIEYVPFQGPGYLKELWMRSFAFMGRVTYRAAGLILTLFDGNRRLQIEQGAPAERVRIIPNGIDVARLALIDDARQATRAAAATAGGGEPAGGETAEAHGDGTPPPEPRRPTVGFVGRVVPIKDVKTLIRATRIAAAALADLEVLVVGPTDEDPEYVRECRDLVESLELGGHIRFLGKRDVREIYPRIDLLVLTSISEALPLVILEAQAAGIPVVATDVGACRELLEGRLEEDRALGPNGLLTGIADPEGTAQAMLRILLDDGERERMAAAGRARVRCYYDLPQVIEQYRSIYREFIALGRRGLAAPERPSAGRIAFARAAAAGDRGVSLALLEEALREAERRYAPSAAKAPAPEPPAAGGDARRN